jgi:hypothetical protein
MFLRHLHLFFIILGLVLMVALAGAQTTAPPPSRQWQKIASLPPGSQLLVREQGNPLQQPCTLVWIDNTALACDVFIPAGGVRRVVYPIATVTSVTQQVWQNEEEEHTHFRALFIGMGCGALAGGLLAKEAGTSAGFAGAAIGSLAGGSLALAATNGFGSPAPPQWTFPLPMRALRMPFRPRRF